jgi:hypothetical protein
MLSIVPISLVQEPRKKLLQSTKLKPTGVGPQGVLQVDQKTKEVLDTWSYYVLRNWAYSKRTFVLVSTAEEVGSKFKGF